MQAGNTMISGLRYYGGHLNRDTQEKLLYSLEAATVKAPLFTPVMPRTGRPFTVRMTNFGPLGWVSDRNGYRYQATHPDTGQNWPPIPALILSLWKELAGYPHEPEACLVNFYQAGAKMGLHRDADEDNLSAPVLSISLGDTAIFRIGGRERGGKTESIKLHSGDVLVLGGESRNSYHGVDRILSGSSSLLKSGGRLNLTVRRVNRIL